MKDKNATQAYASYVAYCDRVEVAPMKFEDWVGSWGNWNLSTGGTSVNNTGSMLNRRIGVTN